MIKIKDLKKDFPKYGFSIECRHLSVESGTAAGIYGPAGSGKTLFTKTLAGLTGSYSGSVEIASTELKNTYRRKIGYLPFRNVLYGNLTLKEMSHYLLGQYKLKREEFDLKLDWFSSLWNISQFTNRRIASLTDGQLQSVKFFTSLLHSPTVLIIDEPFNGLGTESTDSFSAVFDDIRKKQVTVIAASANFDLLEKIVQISTQISNGKIE